MDQKSSAAKSPGKTAKSRYDEDEWSDALHEQAAKKKKKKAKKK